MAEQFSGPNLVRMGPEAAARVQRMLRVAPPHRIFVPCREHIGDIVNTTAAIACLRENFPDAKIVVEVGERAASVLENFPGIDELWLRPTHQGAFGKALQIRRLRKAGFDLAVIFDDSNGHVLHTKLGGIPFRLGIWRGVKYEEMYCGYVPYRREIHELRDHCRELLEMMGCDTRNYRPHLAIQQQDHEAASQALAELSLPNGKPIVGIHPGASVPQRRWPIQHFARLADALREKAHILLLGADADRGAIEEVRQKCIEPPLSLARSLTVLQFAALTSLLDLVVCGDTGPMHIAAVMGTRVVALYGPAYPEHTGPYGEGHAVLQEHCACEERSPRSCSGRCLQELKPERVSAEVERILNERKATRESEAVLG